MIRMTYRGFSLFHYDAVGSATCDFIASFLDNETQNTESRVSIAIFDNSEKYERYDDAE
jgi:hypothetical protein